MQLGKLDASQTSQGLSYKTGNNRAQFDQWLTSEKQNPQLLGLVVQRDDGKFSNGFHDDAPGPFPTRRFAEAIRLRGTRHSNRWLQQ
jgi:hypothetical protein